MLIRKTLLKRKGRQPIMVTNCAELKLINENLIKVGKLIRNLRDFINYSVSKLFAFLAGCTPTKQMKS